MSNFPEMEYKTVEEVIVLPPNGTSLDLLKAVYRRSDLPLMTRMRAAIAALPFESLKLAVVATVNAGDFADQLDRAIERTRKVLTITPNDTANISSNPNDPSSDTKPTAQPSNGHKP